MGAEREILSVRKLQASYASVTVLRDVSWALAPGTCLALLGANGAGKSTLLRSIAGMLVRRSGEIRFNGQDIARLPAHEIATLGIALVPEGRHLFAPLSVEENIRAGSFILRKQGRMGEAAEAADAAFALFPRLAERRRNQAGTLSGGEQQMLAIARALIGRPTVLLLDEPTVGLAPRVVDEMFAVFAELKRRGMTVVVAEQHVPPALDLSDRALVLRLGSVALDAPSRDLVGSDELKRLYLGG